MQSKGHQVQDDLASVFSRNLDLNPELRRPAPTELPRQEPTPPLITPHIVYSVSQHYHHSAHAVKPSVEHVEREVVSVEEQSPRPTSEPHLSQVLASETMLRNFGVDVGILTPAQMHLFCLAGESQRLRLVQLWTICPPNRGGGMPDYAWSSTTLQQEEDLAWERYNNTLMGEHAGNLVRSQVQPVGCTCALVSHCCCNVEPYISCGYEELMRRGMERDAGSRNRDDHGHTGVAVSGINYTPATDPVYLGADYARKQLAMDNMAFQHGTLEHGYGAQEDATMEL
ncbi:hypothetical protein RJ55_02314 [Drechmeria coniospora]|nr:hypothetical protein RJ55_02314 [Drechmeria coniospora]